MSWRWRLNPAPVRLLGCSPRLTVPDLIRTTEYYRDVLGFRIEGYWDGERVTATADATPASQALIPNCHSNLGGDGRR